jgi:hypothetical protein
MQGGRAALARTRAAATHPALMADLHPLIETMENRWMRAWVARDGRTLKRLTASNFRLLVGSQPPVMLDARSWLDAATTRYLCTSYRFGDIYVRDLGGVALFACPMDVGATMDGRDWSGRVWVTDLWRKSRVRRRWQMVERVVSRPDEGQQLPAAIRSLQLWK